MKKTLIKSEDMPDQIKIEMGQNELSFAEELKMDGQKQNPKQSFGPWTQKETFKYFLFLYHHRSKFQSKSLRKSLKVFKQMAKFIKSRNSSQCRTHHQNLTKKSKNLDSILNDFINQNSSFSEKYETMRSSLQILDDIDFCEDTSTVFREAKPINIISQEFSSKNEESKIKMNTSTSLQVLNSPQAQQNNRRNKIIECQRLFNMWMSKVGELSQFYTF